jgi:hypothetical protein
MSDTTDEARTVGDVLYRDMSHTLTLLGTAIAVYRGLGTVAYCEAEAKARNTAERLTKELAELAAHYHERSGTAEDTPSVVAVWRAR